jgi:hypothetical protein
MPVHVKVEDLYKLVYIQIAYITMWNKIILPLQQEESQLNLHNIKAKVILHFILLIATVDRP